MPFFETSSLTSTNVTEVSNLPVGHIIRSLVIGEITNSTLSNKYIVKLMASRVHNFRGGIKLPFTL